jgi:hypothetical protein
MSDQLLRSEADQIGVGSRGRRPGDGRWLLGDRLGPGRAGGEEQGQERD